MVTRIPLLEAEYGAYYQREVPTEDEELTHVGPGTPCGEYFRRFWQPVARSDELKDLPLRVRVLGEDLVAFRDGSGRVGLLGLHCSHRRTSLEYGLVLERGIRCCYHSWVYDVNGQILETPGEPPDSTFKERLWHPAYPVHEYNGLVFAYMGPPEKKPPFPIFDTFEQPGWKMVPLIKRIVPTNWLQMKENCMDPAHLVFLHTRSSGAQFNPDLAKEAEWDFMESPAGMVYIDTRRVGENVWVRMADFIPPNIHQFVVASEGSNLKFRARAERTDWAVPVDDTHVLSLGWHRRPEAEQAEGIDTAFGTASERTYEERQRYPGDFEAWTGQGPITVHALERLATTDRGIIMLRNLVRQGIRAVQTGQEPNGLHREEGKVLPTYGSSTVLLIPPAPTPEEDRALLRKTGRKVAQDFFNDTV